MEWDWYTAITAREAFENGLQPTSTKVVKDGRGSGSLPSHDKLLFYG
jgi:hypothetical protein